MSGPSSKGAPGRRREPASRSPPSSSTPGRTHLWSERFDREERDVFDIQDEISLAIVEHLKGPV